MRGVLLFAMLTGAASAEDAPAKLEVKSDIFGNAKNVYDPCPEGTWWHRSRKDACRPVVCLRKAQGGLLKGLCAKGQHTHIDSGGNAAYPLVCVYDYTEEGARAGGVPKSKGDCGRCTVDAPEHHDPRIPDILHAEIGDPGEPSESRVSERPRLESPEDPLVERVVELRGPEDEFRPGKGDASVSDLLRAPDRYRGRALRLEGVVVGGDARGGTPRLTLADPSDAAKRIPVVFRSDASSPDTRKTVARALESGPGTLWSVVGELEPRRKKPRLLGWYMKIRPAPAE